MDFNLNFHPLDNLIKDKSSFWLEALVPFVDYKYKRYLILYIKYKEITAIMSALEDMAYVESKGFNCKASSMDDIINGLTGFMPRDFSDNIKQMKSMIDMMSMMNSMDGGMPNINQFMNSNDGGMSNINQFMNSMNGGMPNMNQFMNSKGSNHSSHNGYNTSNHSSQSSNHTSTSHNSAIQDNDDLFENIKSILDQEQ